MEQGDLVIEARHDWYGAEYSSARLNTKWKKQFQYGKIEARIMLPTGKGLWPAFWMIGADIDNVGWPNCGEMDIMEGRGSQPYGTICAMHGPGYSGNTRIGATYWSTSRLHLAYHIYTVEWGPGYANYYVDGNFFYSVTPASVPGP